MIACQLPRQLGWPTIGCPSVTQTDKITFHENYLNFLRHSAGGWDGMEYTMGTSAPKSTY